MFVGLFFSVSFYSFSPTSGCREQKILDCFFLFFTNTNPMKARNGGVNMRRGSNKTIGFNWAGEVNVNMFDHYLFSPSVPLFVCLSIYRPVGRFDRLSWNGLRDDSGAKQEKNIHIIKMTQL